MAEINVIKKIKDKFFENGIQAEIPLFKGKKTFEAILIEKGISVSNLASQPFLPWEVFEEAIAL